MQGVTHVVHSGSERLEFGLTRIDDLQDVAASSVPRES